jgi:formylglycine-generating enzyme
MNRSALLLLLASIAAAQAQERAITNSIGMRLVRVEAGAFQMGNTGGRDGVFDEKPVHRVRIGRPFYIGALEVTNAQYEQFDPGHRNLRGKLGFSKGDDEAVVFVSWQDAVRFTVWLSEKEGRPYRLPSEAEWEYAARAGTSTDFHTGDSLPAAYLKNARNTWYPDPARSAPEKDIVDLTVGRTPANAWGLADVHGNVEEWCLDWYGPYEAGEQVDPLGPADGDFRVTRGGSHSTDAAYLRSASRMGTLPDERNWLIGFRVVLGAKPGTRLKRAAKPELYQRNVRQSPAAPSGPDPAKPYFQGPRQYVKIAPGSTGPMYSRHNHDPAITECPNGDLLAIWYTCESEAGRELGVLASRLRAGTAEWEPASLFWDAPGRNDHAPALWFDGKRTIYHFNGLAAAGTWGSLAVIQRASTDNGVTWSKARLIMPEHALRHQPVESVFRTREGFLLLPADAASGGNGGTAIHISRDEGTTWEDPGGTIAGIHAGVAQRKDGSLIAFGRSQDIDGKMPMSSSHDMGKTWTHRASPFPPISSGQRLVLLRLREGPLFFASFAAAMQVTDASGKQREVSGLFGALSFDDGETWTTRRLISDDGPGRQVESMDGALFTLSAGSAEPKGYLSVCQSADGVIHLICSRQHYAFNLAWLKTPPPAMAPASGSR